MKNKVWYLAHPYSANSEGEIESNVYNCVKATNKLIDLGFVIISPIIMTHWLHKKKNRSWKEWIDYDKSLMDKCDGLILTEGWGKSEGCAIEKSYFEKQNKPIKYFEDIVNGV